MPAALYRERAPINSADMQKLFDFLFDPETPVDRQLALHLFVHIAIIGDTSTSPVSEQTVASLGSSLRSCNCDEELARAELYCDGYCREMAKHVRYIRNIVVTGRQCQTDIQEAVSARLLMITGGGCPTEERRLTKMPDDLRMMRSTT
jgi:hypothetical protein